MSIDGRQVVSGSDFRNLSRQFSAESQAVTDLQGRISRALASSIWEGAARQSFQADWDSQFVPTLRRLADSLNQVSTELTQRASVADELNRR